jgi:non-ribosomal peptide synthetase component F
MTNLSLNLGESAEMYPDRPALRCEDATTTYRALLDEVAQMARFLLDAGIEPGDPGGHHVAQFSGHRRRLLRDFVCRRGRGADEPPAERPGGHVLLTKGGIDRHADPRSADARRH